MQYWMKTPDQFLATWRNLDLIVCFLVLDQEGEEAKKKRQANMEGEGDWRLEVR